MKYSVATGDMGAVYLDGKPLQDVIECDTTEGTVTVYARDEAGNLIVDLAKDEVVKKKLRGVVSFVRRIVTA